MKTSSPEFSTPLPAAASVREPSPPPWVKRLLDVPSHPFATPNRALAARECISSSLALISVRISDADALPADDLQRITTEAYGIIRRRLQSIGRPHPIRFWNHIPDINARIDEAIDRYMVFNAGRFAAFRDWFGEPASAFPRAVATASGVGHHGKDLVIHCLAADTPGAAVDAVGYSSVPLTVVVDGRFFAVEQFLHLVRTRVQVAEEKVAASGRLLDVQSVTLDQTEPAPMVTATLAMSAFYFTGTAAPPVATTTVTTTTPSS
jgi:hypothetical protein